MTITKLPRPRVLSFVWSIPLTGNLMTVTNNLEVLVSPQICRSAWGSLSPPSPGIPSHTSCRIHERLRRLMLYNILWSETETTIVLHISSLWNKLLMKLKSVIKQGWCNIVNQQDTSYVKQESICNTSSRLCFRLCENDVMLVWKTQSALVRRCDARQPRRGCGLQSHSVWP